MKSNNKFKSVGLFSIILLSIILLSVIPSVSSDSGAINTFLKYEDSPTLNSKTVTQGNSFNLVLVAYGHGESLEYEKLGLVGSTLIFEEHVSGEQILEYTYLYTKTYTLNTGILNPGTYTLRFTARTKTTHSEEYSELQLIILPKIVPPICGDNVCNGAETCSTCPGDCGICSDTIVPVVNITNPLAKTYTSQRTILTFSVYDDNLDSCFYKLNEAPKVDIPSVVNGFNTITGISSVTGANDWLVTCKDKSGNLGSYVAMFVVSPLNPPVCGDNVCNGLETCSTCPGDCGICSDTIVPVVNITNPLAKTYTSQRTILTFSVYDDNLDSCFYKLNEAPKVDIPSVVNGFNTITGISSVTGANDWLVTCKDKSGNLGSYVAMFVVSPPNPPVCGDNVCNGLETCSTCPGDCGICAPTCGDNVCNGNENCSTCPCDCGECQHKCTACKDSKPLVDDPYYIQNLNKKITTISQQQNATVLSLSLNKSEKSFLGNKSSIVFWVLIVGILFLLMAMIITRLIKR